MEKQCELLVNKCKAEAKSLVEITATKRKVHWTHSSFIAFCVSVDDILSYGVKSRYRTSRGVSYASRILKQLGKTLPAAMNVYKKAFLKESQEDYSIIQNASSTEQKVLWLRVAIIDGNLTEIVDQLVENPRAFYEDKSVLCDPVYSQVFKSLIDGPCSIRFSRLKFSESAVSSLSPSELVTRHKKVLSISVNNSKTVSMPTEKAWNHVQSLYQTSSSTCLFGKNNISVRQAGASTELLGYLTLQEAGSQLQLKWIPNMLINESSQDTSGLWENVIDVDITGEIAHIHCHRAQGCSAEMILIGYDGIAKPPLLFPHQPSLFMFLECLENSLLPQGTLEPPLWYLKESATKSKNAVSNGACDDEWFNSMETWNHVFRIRHGSQTTVPVVPETTPTQPLPLTLLAPYRREESMSDSSSQEEEPVVMETQPSSTWEAFHSEVSKQLLARHFYTWLSHCRHMTKVRASVSHLVSHTHLMSIESDKGPLSESMWRQFLAQPLEKRAECWKQLLSVIYLAGVQHSMRAEVWPFLLGVYPLTSTAEERAQILTKLTLSYRQLLSGWKTAELTQRELADSREPSPELSSVSPSPTLSPVHPRQRSDRLPSTDSDPGTPHEPQASLAEAEIAERLGANDRLSNGDVIPHMSCDNLRPMSELDEKGAQFLIELYNIDKDIPRCDRDYWYFMHSSNLLKVRNLVCSFVWENLSEGYSQGMCDLLAPILVAIDNEPLVYACYVRVMSKALKLFPPNTAMNTRLANVLALLQVTEPDYHSYLTQRPTGDGLFYCYRWLLISFKREFSYQDLFRVWECMWASRLTVSEHFEEFFALALMKQYQSAIMDAHLDPSDILNLFTDLADKNKIDCEDTLTTAIRTIHKLQEDLVAR